MPTDTLDDPWLMPTRQRELPARALIPSTQLHGRREATFLALATLFIVATAAAVILGASRILVVDVDSVLQMIAPDYTFPLAVELPIGVLLLPLTFLAVNLVCELFGRRRANALIAAGLVTTIALAGLMLAVDAVDGTSASLGPALALISYYVIAQTSNVVIFDALRGHRFGALRHLVSSLLAQLGAWAVFAFVSYGYATEILGASASIVGSITVLAISSALYVGLATLVSVIPFAALGHVLEAYLRVDVLDEEVAGEEVEDAWSEPSVPPRRAPAMIVEDAPARPAALWTTGEMRFFDEGEQLGDSGPIRS